MIFIGNKKIRANPTIVRNALYFILEDVLCPRIHRKKLVHESH